MPKEIRRETSRQRGGNQWQVNELERRGSGTRREVRGGGDTDGTRKAAESQPDPHPEPSEKALRSPCTAIREAAAKRGPRRVPNRREAAVSQLPKRRRGGVRRSQQQQPVHRLGALNVLYRYSSGSYVPARICLLVGIETYQQTPMPDDIGVFYVLEVESAESSMFTAFFEKKGIIKTRLRDHQNQVSAKTVNGLTCRQQPSTA